MRETHVREILSKIRLEIVTRSAESRALAAQARALHAGERHQKQMERRAFGRCTRWVLLAYAWLRARPYARAEPVAVVPVELYRVKGVLHSLGIAAEAGEIGRWLRGESAGFAWPSAAAGGALVPLAEAAREGGGGSAGIESSLREGA